MIVYLAGNLPGREKEAKTVFRSFFGNWLLSYYYILSDISVLAVFLIFKRYYDENIFSRNSGD